MNTAGKHLIFGLVWCLLRASPCLCAVTACVNEHRFVVVNATPAVSTAGFQLTSVGGNLIPIPPSPAPAAPFTFLLSNTASEVTWGNLGRNVTIAGDWVTAVGYKGQVNPAFDLSIVYAGQPDPASPPLVTGYCGATGLVKGDFNLDSVVDRLDIGLLGLEISGKTNNEAFDLTGDQLVDQHDLNWFLGGNIITSGNKFNGDADFDGRVAFFDLLILASNFGQVDKKWSEGDFIANGWVEFDDFLVLAVNFGKLADSASPVPEPPTGIMLLASLFFGRWRRPRHASLPPPPKDSHFES